MSPIPQKIIFVHQAKAAGTTLVEALKLTYGVQQVCHDQDNQDLWKMSKWRRQLEFKLLPYRKYKDREQYRVIHGHFTSAKYRGAFPDAFYLTFYRHPVQQLVSHYHYWLRQCNPRDSNPLRSWVYETRPSLLAFATKMFDMGLLRERAQASKVEDFDFVGITERLDDSMKLLKLHIPELVLDIGRQRVNPDKQVGESYVLTHEEEESLNTMLRPRIALYDEAVKRFETDWNVAAKLTLDNI